MRRVLLGTTFALAAMTAAYDASAASINLGVTIRDFSFGASATNLDFNNGNYTNNYNGGADKFNGLDTGAVNSVLGADNKPVFNQAGTNNPTRTAGGGSTSFSTATNFNQWYNSSAANQTFNQVLTLNNSVGQPNVYTFSSNSYFPIDGQGFGAQGQTHNFGFTLELHTTFTYVAGSGQVFNFNGDDDLWVFINKNLAIDLGGTHGSLAGSVNLDTQAVALGLVNGGTYQFDLFYAERHVSQSNLTLSTSILFNNTVPEPATMALLGAGLLGLGGIARRRRKAA